MQLLVWTVIAGLFTIIMWNKNIYDNKLNNINSKLSKLYERIEWINKRVSKLELLSNKNMKKGDITKGALKVIRDDVSENLLTNIAKALGTHDSAIYSITRNLKQLESKLFTIRKHGVIKLTSSKKSGEEAIGKTPLDVLEELGIKKEEDKHD